MERRKSDPAVLAGFAVLFAILAPLLTHLTVRESIRRALSIMVVATPLSAVISIPLVGLVGIFSASRFGALFGKASAIEKLSDIKTVVIDKAGVLAEECPKLLSVQSDILDTGTFLTFAAHAVYYSEQPIAKALANATDGEYKLEVVSNFRELPGYGVEVDIGNAHVTFATKELFISRGEAVPYEGESSDALNYYMMIAGRYVGRVAVSNSALDSADQLVPELKKVGVGNCILISEDGRDELAAFARRLGFDDAYGELDVEKKLSVIAIPAERCTFIPAGSNPTARPTLTFASARPESTQTPLSVRTASTSCPLFFRSPKGFVQFLPRTRSSPWRSRRSSSSSVSTDGAIFGSPCLLTVLQPCSPSSMRSASPASLC